MPIENFHLVSEWRVRAPVARVYETLADLATLAKFWPNVRVVGDGAAPEVVGRHAELRIKGILPIALRADVEIVAAEPDRMLAVVSHGDLEGHGSWRFDERDGVTRARFTWDVELRQALLARAARRLRRLLVLSHRWAMWRGERGLRRLLEPRN